MNNDVVLAYFAPCGAGHIGAELCSRVHVACSSKVVEPLECHRTFIFSTSTFYWSATDKGVLKNIDERVFYGVAAKNFIIY